MFRRLASGDWSAMRAESQVIERKRRISESPAGYDIDSSACAIYIWSTLACGRRLPERLPFSPAGEREVTKKEIVKTISEEIGMTQLRTKEIVQETFDAIVETLVQDGRIELRNFGVFEVKKRAARKARNPRTEQRVDVTEKFVVTFKPGKEMEVKVRLIEELDASGRAAAAVKSHPPVSLY